MFITLSWPRIASLIRELENLPDFTDDEMAVRLDLYARRLFDHARKYGISVKGLATQGGNNSSIAAFSADIAHCHSEEARSERIAGMELLRPVAVTLQCDDLDSLVLNVPVRAAMKEAWPEIEDKFQRILPPQILDLLESVAGKVAFGPRPAWKGPSNEIDFSLWLSENGLKDPTGPGTRHMRAIEEAQAAEELRRQERDEAWRNEHESTSFNVREL